MPAPMETPATAKAATVAQTQQLPKLPPFDLKRAKTLLTAEKMNGPFRDRIPTETETAAYLRRHFRGIPSDLHRKARQSVWPNVPPGRRRKAKAVD